MNLAGVQIAHGYSPESRVFAALLGHRGDCCESLVLHHDWAGDRASASRFEADSGARIVRLDTGWRPNRDGRRSFVARALSRARFQASLPTMLKIARPFSPDVIYSNQQKWDCTAATYFATKLGKPQIIHLHYHIGPWLGRPVLRRLQTCTHVIAVSDFVRAEAVRHGVHGERVTTLRNAVAPLELPSNCRASVRAELGFPHRTPLIGMFARLAEGKGQDDLLAAFGIALRSHPEARLLIAGDGPTQRQLHSRSRELGLAQAVRFLGFRRDIPRLLGALDIFAHPSRREPFGLAVAEAAAAGLPSVAYREGAMPELIVDGRTGFLADAGDIAGLALRIDRLLDETELARAMGAAARERMLREFRPSDAGKAFARLVRAVAGDAAPEARAIVRPSGNGTAYVRRSE
jgi:glycosyltransferase involved in cell wall biosynthesis